LKELRLSILAICYNHEKFLDQALGSIEKLSGMKPDVWIADDRSQDNSIQILKRWQEKRPDWNFTFNDRNIGNCKTFNVLLNNCKGDFVIDFSTDDLLIPENIRSCLEKLNSKPEASFCYTDAIVFGQKTAKEYHFSQRIGRFKSPEGKITRQLLGIPFICPPAVIFRKSALEKVGGYDESLAYEDLDIWLRLSQSFEVVYFPEVIVKYRKHKNSLSSSLFRNRNRSILQSTVSILKKISNWEEFRIKDADYFSFVKYHLKIASALQLQVEANEFYKILKENGKIGIQDRLWKMISSIGFPIFSIIFWRKRN